MSEFLAIDDVGEDRSDCAQGYDDAAEHPSCSASARLGVPVVDVDEQKYAEQ
jgi:hypothetical protein